jgi:hypothetical protein
MKALEPYWRDPSANEDAIRGFLQLGATRSQYLDGVADPTTVNPDLWELDQRHLDCRGVTRVMLNLLYDYQDNVRLYPRWHSGTAALPRGSMPPVATTRALPTSRTRTATPGRSRNAASANGEDLGRKLGSVRRASWRWPGERITTAYRASPIPFAGAQGAT